MSTRPPMIISNPTAQPDSPDVSSTAPRDLHVLRGAGLALLLIGSAVLYLWGLSESGWANSYYSAAVQAGSQSWKAFLFGSLDASNAVTVDTPPASLWLMALSVRIFGLNSWSILVPQALLGVATVAVLYASVRRTVDSGRSRSADSTLATGHVAGLVAGAVLALTPVAVLMFRFNTPDALLVFLLTATGYCTLRASEEASGKWLVGAGVLVGLAFLTKMWPAFVVLPALVVVYLVVAPTSMGRRIRHLLAALIAMIISLGWWVALVELVPESWRPYVGGSDNNSVLGLIFGDHGLNRMLEGVSGGMIAWLIPAALLLGTFALIIRRRAPRTDGVRAAIMVWGGTLLVTGLSFLLMAGASDDGYDPVALAPATAALVAIGGQVLWVRRRAALARAGLAATMIITGLTAYALLGRASAPVRHPAVAGVDHLCPGRRWPSGGAPTSPATRRDGPRPGAGRRHRRARGVRGADRGDAASRLTRGERGGPESAAERRGQLRLGGRDTRRPARRGVPAGHRAAGDGGRWVRRQRQQPDLEAVPGLRRRRAGPLLPRWWRVRRLGQARRRDRDLGQPELPRDHRGRRHAL